MPFDFSKLPMVFDTMRLDVTSFDSWDNIPTAVYFKFKVLPQNKEIHSQIITYTNIRATDAILKDLSKILNVVERTRDRDYKKIDIYIHDFFGFMIATGQLSPVTNTSRRAYKQLEKRLKRLNEDGYAVKIYLGDYEFHYKFAEDYLKNQLSRTTVSPTKSQIKDYLKDEFEREKSARREFRNTESSS